jgi:hypothetical protein
MNPQSVICSGLESKVMSYVFNDWSFYIIIVYYYYYLNLEGLTNVSHIRKSASLFEGSQSSPVCLDRNSFMIKMRVGNGGMALPR